MIEARLTRHSCTDCKHNRVCRYVYDMQKLQDVIIENIDDFDMKTQTKEKTPYSGNPLVQVNVMCEAYWAYPTSIPEPVQRFDENKAVEMANNKTYDPQIVSTEEIYGPNCGKK